MPPSQSVMGPKLCRNGGIICRLIACIHPQIASITATGATHAACNPSLVAFSQTCPWKSTHGLRLLTMMRLPQCWMLKRGPPCLSSIVP